MDDGKDPQGQSGECDLKKKLWFNGIIPFIIIINKIIH